MLIRGETGDHAVQDLPPLEVYVEAVRSRQRSMGGGRGGGGRGGGVQEI
jgi:hypothetical protein